MKALVFQRELLANCLVQRAHVKVSPVKNLKTLVRLAQTRADVLVPENHRLVNPDQALNQIAVTETQDQSLARQVPVTLHQRQLPKKLLLKSAHHGNEVVLAELKKTPS
jgi:hypothetical protein